jgi:hypothetical protein
MSTIKTFEDLQELGCNSIHENTHISRTKIEAVLNKSFGELTKVQFMGFLSILEREYKVDLSLLREEYDAYVQQHLDTLIPQKSVILQAQSRTRRVWVLGAFVVVLLLLGIGWIIQGNLSIFPREEVMQLSTASIEVPEENLSMEVNASADVNATDVNSSQLVLSQMQEDNQSIVTDAVGINLGHVQSIKPIHKVWVGMMNLETGVKTQKVTDRPIVIDATKNWLFMFGHGRLEIETRDKNITLEEKDTVWFSCENGKLIQLNHKQFQAKNNGTNW